jgi:hypothetical protein
MAGNKNSGGFRPTAPQNNPANVSATGGAGQSGTQPAKYISGLPYGQGQATMIQQQSAPMAGSPEPSAPKQNPLAAMPPVESLTAPTSRPNEPISTGMPFGPGAGPEILNLPQDGTMQYQTARDVIQSIANEPDASPIMKYLASKIGQQF